MSVPPVTLRDVASAAGVHFSTVSRALRGDARIASATRARVQEVASRLGYQPNPAAQALVRRRQGHAREQPTIAYLVNESAVARTERHEFRAEVLAGARAQARLLGFHLKVYPFSAAGLEAEGLEERLQRDRVECVVLALLLPGSTAPHLEWERYCLVRIDSQHLEPALHTVSTDRIHNVRLGYRTLRALGARRIGLCVSRWQEEGTRQRHAMGYLMEESALPASHRLAPLSLPYGLSSGECGRWVKEWVRLHRPEALLHDGSCPAEFWDRLCPRLPRLDLNGGGPRMGGAGLEVMARIVGEKAVAAVAMLLRIGARGTPRLATDTYVEGRWRDA